MIFTTEPEANRALGAELRACPDEARQFFSLLLDKDLGALTDVAMPYVSPLGVAATRTDLRYAFLSIVGRHALQEVQISDLL